MHESGIMNWGRIFSFDNMIPEDLDKNPVPTQPAHNVLRTSPYGPTFVEMSWTIIGPTYDVLDFKLILALQCLVCTRYYQNIERIP